MYSSTYATVTKFYAFWTFPGTIGTTISPYVVVPSTEAQAVAATFIRSTAIESAAHTIFVTSITRLVELCRENSVNVGAIWIVTACKSLE